MISAVLSRLVARESLACEEAHAAMGEIMEGRATQAQIAAFATALRMKGETPEEILGCARAMRERVVRVETGGLDPVLDTCGTGGDGKGTFNFSTLAAVVVSACGVAVAKHGNRAASSKCGSADLLEGFGVRIELPLPRVCASLRENGITYMHAPAHHPAMRHAAPVRREIGFRTIFNLLGPLTNPAFANVQTIGVFDPGLVEPFARVLCGLGSRSAFVFHGAGGLDEVSLLGETRTARLRRGRIARLTLRPADAGLRRARLRDLVGGSPGDNLEIARRLLRGEPGAYRDGVLFSAGLALVAAERSRSVRSGVEGARRALDSGAALRRLETWAEWTRRD